MGALVMFALAIIIANVAGIYYWRQDKKEKGSQGTISLANTLRKGQV